MMTPSSKAEFLKLTKKAEKDIRKAGLKLLSMVLFIAVITFIIGINFVPGSTDFIIFGNASGGILAMIQAINEVEAIHKKLQEDTVRVRDENYL